MKEFLCILALLAVVCLVCIGYAIHILSVQWIVREMVTQECLITHK